MSKKLYIPGPVEVSADVLEAMATPMIGHRMKEYAVLHKEVTDGLKKLLNAPGPVFLATSSAFGVMEGAVRNLVQKRCACFANGAFSKKWYEVTPALRPRSRPVQRRMGTADHRRNGRRGPVFR